MLNIYEGCPWKQRTNKRRKFIEHQYSLQGLRGTGPLSRDTTLLNCFSSFLIGVYSKRKEFDPKCFFLRVFLFRRGLVHMKANRKSKKCLPCQIGRNSTKCIHFPQAPWTLIFKDTKMDSDNDPKVNKANFFWAWKLIFTFNHIE